MSAAMRKNKMIQRERQLNGRITNNLVGLMAIKLKFSKDDSMTPVKLICFGSLPLRSKKILKIFEGPKCHIRFLLWALQNVAEYKIDNRKDYTKLNFFTFNGSQKEFPILLRGFAQLAGRDVHFFGDLNRIKCLWHENIKFFDLANFFDTNTVNKMASEWRKNILMSTFANMSTSNSEGDDVHVYQVKTIFDLANRFQSELE